MFFFGDFRQMEVNWSGVPMWGVYEYNFRDAAGRSAWSLDRTSGTTIYVGRVVEQHFDELGPCYFTSVRIIVMTFPLPPSELLGNVGASGSIVRECQIRDTPICTSCAGPFFPCLLHM